MVTENKNNASTKTPSKPGLADLASMAWAGAAAFLGTCKEYGADDRATFGDSLRKNFGAAQRTINGNGKRGGRE